MSGHPVGAGPAIVTRGLTKDFGSLRAVDHLDLEVHHGRVTGFLGPNGSGKTTTMAMILDLVAPTAGTAEVGGRRARDHEWPLRVVGAALENTGFAAHRSGRNHLRCWAPAAGASAARNDELLEVVGLTEAADRAVGGYSLGMRQRLSLATALLGDPSILLLDEPANGLDPEGILWLRRVLREHADEGRAVLVSSHVLAEVERLADDVVVIADGRLRYDGTLADLVGDTGAPDLESAYLDLTTEGRSHALAGAH